MASSLLPFEHGSASLHGDLEERDIDSVLGATVGVGVECHLRDCSGVGGGQVIKKDWLVSWLTLVLHPKGEKYLVGHVLKRIILYYTSSSSPSAIGWSLVRTELEKQYKPRTMPGPSS